jgi:hypothetical protein
MRPSKFHSQRSLSPAPVGLARTSSLIGAAALALATLGCIDRPVTPVKPTTTNVSVEVRSTAAVDKIDLLFMIDNSISMSDKQKTLQQAVPVLVRRLVTPNCVDAEGAPTGGVADAQGRCADGQPEFQAIRDIHIGVVSSSLGGNGGDACVVREDDVTAGRTPDDRGELLPSANPAVRGALNSWNGSGFLAWDPGQDKNQPPGEGDVERLIGDFAGQVVAAGERGCGYESSLEAWYRFLVDPEPPVSVTKVKSADGTLEVNQRGPVNEALLAQRRAFLRPDSLLAIVMLTDENDCSIVGEDGSQGWLVSATQSPMPRASAACKDPNDRCCHTCATPAPEGCTPNEQDPECSQKSPGQSYAVLSATEDSSHLRCFAQKRRFGMDLLYPVERYIDGLTKPTVRNRAGTEVPNPVFQLRAGDPVRAANLVLLAGIVGVPWQDLATQESLTGQGLEYLTAEELTKEGRWDVILGGASGPSDPLMRESVAVRTGNNPILNTPLVGPGSNEPQNPINGNEQNIAEADDLQYACTFPLATPRQCTQEDKVSCDCNADEQTRNRSLCDYPNGPGTDGIQHSAKAYPGVRTLEVLRGVGNNGIVASICPKNTTPRAGLTPAGDAAYGYNPAIAALLEIVKERLPSQCLSRPLPVNSDPASPEFGQVPCAVVEALPRGSQACSCDATRGRTGLETAHPNLARTVRERLAIQGVCDGGRRACDDYCLCQLAELEGPDRIGCQDGATDPDTFGYCYVDPDQGIGNPELVSDCSPTTRRILRFVGENLPANGSSTFIACVGASLTGGDPE